MRPRKKPNLLPRLAACEPVLLKDPAFLNGRMREVFQNPNAPLHLEIGCGKGRFACELAARFPEINFVAMEREENIAVIAAEHTVKAGLSNLRLMIQDAQRLPEIFAPGELSRIYINFCDPWHKRRQYKRRLTYRAWLEIYRALLCDGGEIRFKTDNELLYRFSLGEFAAVLPPYFMTEDLHNSELSAQNIMTEYEEYFSGLGQPIYSIHTKK